MKLIPARIKLLFSLTYKIHSVHLKSIPAFSLHLPCTVWIEQLSNLTPVQVSTWSLHLYSLCCLSVSVCSRLNGSVLCDRAWILLSFNLPSLTYSGLVLVLLSVFVCTPPHLEWAAVLLNGCARLEDKVWFLCTADTVKLVEFLCWTQAVQLFLWGQCERGTRLLGQTTPPTYAVDGYGAQNRVSFHKFSPALYCIVVSQLW